MKIKLLANLYAKWTDQHSSSLVVRVSISEKVIVPICKYMKTLTKRRGKCLK